MFDKQYMKAFFWFLDSATDDELAKRETLYEQILEVAHRGGDTYNDARYLLRKVREEKAARINLQAIRQARKQV